MREKSSGGTLPVYFLLLGRTEENRRRDAGATKAEKSGNWNRAADAKVEFALNALQQKPK
jgi:hypothetical protein